MNRGTVGLLLETSPRAEDWRRVFGGLEVPIRSPWPVMANLPGREPGLVYLVAVERLEADQLDRLVTFLSERFGHPADEVRAGLLGEHGLPVLAEDIVTAFDPRVVL